MKGLKGQIGVISLVILSFILIAIVIPIYLILHSKTSAIYSSYLSTLQESFYSGSLEAIGDVKIVGTITNETGAQITIINDSLAEKRIESIFIASFSSGFIKKIDLKLNLTPRSYNDVFIDLSDIYAMKNEVEDLVIIALTSNNEIIKGKVFSQEELNKLFTQEETAYLSGFFFIPISNPQGTSVVENLLSGGITLNQIQVELPFPQNVRNGSYNGIGVAKDTKIAAKPQLAAYVLSSFFKNVNISISNLSISNLFLGYHYTDDESFNILITHDSTGGTIRINGSDIQICKNYSKYGFRIKMIGFKSDNTTRILTLYNESGNKLREITSPPEDPVELMYLSSARYTTALSLNGFADAVYVYCVDTTTTYPSSYDPYLLIYRLNKNSGSSVILFTTEDAFYGNKSEINDLRVKNSATIDYSQSQLELIYNPKNISINNRDYRGVFITVQYRYHDNELDYYTGVSQSALDKEVFSFGVKDSLGNIVGYRSVTLKELATTKLTYPPTSLPQLISLYVPLPYPDITGGVKEFYVYLMLGDPLYMSKSGNDYVDDLDLTLLIESVSIILIS